MSSKLLIIIHDYHNLIYPLVCSAILGTLFDVGGDKEAAGYSNYFRIQYFSVGLAVKISIDGIKDVSLFG